MGSLRNALSNYQLPPDEIAIVVELVPTDPPAERDDIRITVRLAERALAVGADAIARAATSGDVVSRIRLRFRSRRSLCYELVPSEGICLGFSPNGSCARRRSGHLPHRSRWFGQDEMQACRAGHVPGAIGWIWKVALWDPAMREFPSPEAFATRHAASGIGNDTTVVFYGEDIQFGIALKVRALRI